jgi:hypothetical protein
MDFVYVLLPDKEKNIDSYSALENSKRKTRV